MTQHHQLQLQLQNNLEFAQQLTRPRSATAGSTTATTTFLTPPQQPTSNMVRSSSAEPARSSKRKGTRSVSTLTPAQLARKRANDREAQRAIRARTREHIDRLEQELDELRTQQGRDQTVQELLRRNRALEDEVGRLRETMGGGVPMTPSAYSAPVYDDALSTASGVIPSPRTSPFPAGDFSSLPDLSQSFVGAAGAGGLGPNNCEAWASAVPPTSAPSNVSSPSSTGGADDYTTAAPNNGYIPTSVPSSLLTSHAGKDVKLESYEEMDTNARRRVPPQQHLGSSGHDALPWRPPPSIRITGAPGGPPPPPPVGNALQPHVLPAGAVPCALSGPSQYPSSPSPSHPSSYPSSPGWDVVPRLSAPTCRLDELLVGFIQQCRGSIGSSVDGAESARMMLGPPVVDVRPLFPAAAAATATSSVVTTTTMNTTFTPSAAPGSATQQLLQPVARHHDSRVAHRHASLPNTQQLHRLRHQQRPLVMAPVTELLRAVVDTAGVTGLLERMAMFALTHAYVCWLSCPTPDARARLPDELAPRPSQLSTPHPQWIDLVVWGRLRDALVAHQGAYVATPDLQRAYFGLLRLVNWPGQPYDGLEPQGAAQQRKQHLLLLNGAFTAHALDARNWRLDGAFAQRYPELSGCVDLLA